MVASRSMPVMSRRRYRRLRTKKVMAGKLQSSKSAKHVDKQADKMTIEDGE